MINVNPEFEKVYSTANLVSLLFDRSLVKLCNKPSTDIAFLFNLVVFRKRSLRASTVR